MTAHLWDSPCRKANDQILSAPRRGCLQGLVEHGPTDRIKHDVGACMSGQVGEEWGGEARWLRGSATDDRPGQTWCRLEFAASAGNQGRESGSSQSRKFAAWPRGRQSRCTHVSPFKSVMSPIQKCLTLWCHRLDGLMQRLALVPPACGRQG